MLVMEVNNDHTFTIIGTGQEEGISLFCDYKEIVVSASNPHGWLPGLRVTAKGLDNYIKFLELTIVALKEAQRKMQENN